jgi:hypothetical protein
MIRIICILVMAIAAVWLIAAGLLAMVFRRAADRHRQDLEREAEKWEEVTAEDVGRALDKLDRPDAIRAVGELMNGE